MTSYAPSREELIQADGSGVRLLVIDSGVDLAHKVFEGRTVPCWAVEPRGRSFQVAEVGSGDTIGHGTAVAGIIFKNAPGVHIESLRVLDADRGSSTDRCLHALRWAIEQKYDVVNCSFGSKGTRYVGLYKRVVDLAFCANVLLIGACSNEEHQPTSYPACFPAVVSADRVDLPSAKPPALPALRRRPAQLVEFALRGIDVSAPWKGGGQRKVSGSSFAAPHLAALVARIRQLRPDWNACQVKALLYELAEPAEPADDEAA